MTTRQKISYALLSLRSVTFLTKHPIFGARLFWKRLAFLFTRRFVGDAITSPITGESIFNIQSLINAWAMQAIQELGTEWYNDIRETVAPVVIDVGANIGQFGHLIKSLNPRAYLIGADPAKEIEKYCRHYDYFRSESIGVNTDAVLTSGGGWTGSTEHGFYKGNRTLVSQGSLDGLWLPSSTIEISAEITLLKIDVDGAEIGVLESGKNLIQCCKWIIIEVNSPEALAALPSGFKWSTINGHDWIGRRID